MHVGKRIGIMKITFITSNEGKFNEVRLALGNEGHEVVWLRRTYPEIQTALLEEVVEEGLEWVQARMAPSGPFMIEDSGLFIDALGGFPGVFSAYVFKTIGNAGILKLMKGEKNRGASFESRIGFYSKESGPHIFRGSCPGTIAAGPKGKMGFGYDPIFIPRGRKRTFGQMTDQSKNRISHRGKSVEAFLAFLKSA
jgi:XTP/dITP diphosphohydrolase